MSELKKLFQRLVYDNGNFVSKEKALESLREVKKLQSDLDTALDALERIKNWTPGDVPYEEMLYISYLAADAIKQIKGEE